MFGRVWTCSDPFGPVRKKKSTRRKSTRSAATKKCSRRRLNSKKMRGGVTRTCSGRTRKRKIEITNIPREILRGHDKSLNARIRGFIRPALTDATIKDAVWDYIRGGTIQKQSVVTKYGDISNWDVSKVTNMNGIFRSYARSQRAQVRRKGFLDRGKRRELRFGPP